MDKEKEALWGLRSVLEFLGADPDDEGLEDTPVRVLKYLKDCCSGYHQDPEEILSATFENPDEDGGEFIMLKNIEFKSTCEHHLLPIVGTVSIAYLPKERVVGISKLARLVDALSARLQLQERLTDQIAHSLDRHLRNRGVAVFVSATHYCMKVAGVKKTCPVMETSCFLGQFKEDAALRDRFLDRID